MVVIGTIAKEGEAYGYGIVEKLSRLPGLELSESTVYPMLARLAKERLLAIRNEPSPAGPPRRYYRLTPLGESLKPVVGGMYEWGLRFIAPTLQPARPATRAGRTPDTPRAAVLRLLAEGPAKPKPV